MMSPERTRTRRGRPAGTPLAEALYRAVLAAALDPIVTVDTAGVIRSASDSVRTALGWGPGELIGNQVGVLLPGGHRGPRYGGLAGGSGNGKAGRPAQAHRREAARKDGTLVPVRVSVSLAEAPGWPSPLLVCVIRTLNEDGAAGEGAASGGEAYGPRAGPGSRTQRLLAEQASALVAAHQRLRMSDRLASIGALAAGLGHDMNNVLLPVRAHLEAARAGALVPEVRRHVEAVHKSVTYLQQLADGLHFLALDAEGDDAERAATDVAAWWDQVGPLLTKAVPKHAVVEASIGPGLPAVAVSTHGLTQAVLNLVVNAGEAIPPPARRPAKGARGRERIRIAARAERDGAHVTLSVTDRGRGMSEETRHRAFEMFYTTRARGLGTGLGLPLVARIVRRAGGSVHIRSRLGGGTTVSLLLPSAGSAETRARSRRAVVAVADGRAAAMTSHLLEAAGVRVAASAELHEADLWVAEATPQGLADARAWRKRHPEGSLVVLGPTDAGSARAWKSLRARVVADRADLDAIRSVLGHSLDCP